MKDMKEMRMPHILKKPIGVLKMSDVITMAKIRRTQFKAAWCTTASLVKTNVEAKLDSSLHGVRIRGRKDKEIQTISMYSHIKRKLYLVFLLRETTLLDRLTCTQQMPEHCMQIFQRIETRWRW
jgi:hypothetical protein